MKNVQAKTLGLIALGLGAKILIDLGRGQPVGGAQSFADLIGLGDRAARAISFALGLFGIVFGLRALFWSRVCWDDQCTMDSARPCSGASDWWNPRWP